jgi:hypothetical protein
MPQNTGVRLEKEIGRMKFVQTNCLHLIQMDSELKVSTFLLTSYDWHLVPCLLILFNKYEPFSILPE